MLEPTSKRQRARLLTDERAGGCFGLSPLVEVKRWEGFYEAVTADKVSLSSHRRVYIPVLYPSDCSTQWCCTYPTVVSERNAQARPTDLHALPDARAGEGIPHEPLPHQAEADRDGTLALPDGTADQDLVPESADEAEEGDTGDQGAERTREAGACAEGSGSSGRGCAAAASGRWGTGGGQLGVRPAPEPP
ncbi:hypothetical protein K0M31_020297 [Melipona bicolor]|uniref:Uncharacterized protein n=1 Tax=Melipona bicolor TaxID=60889 RepID=A0AA40G1W2_9HYME|nr:hypothetical protein K0M31_020297 [Melipona bicolor]